MGTRQDGRVDYVGILLAILLFVCVGFQFHPRTADGVQCPTAPIQTVLRSVKAPCGCIIGYRADTPRPGDKEFVQCRCAEKKNADYSADATLTVDLFYVPLPSLNFPLPWPSEFGTPQVSADLHAAVSSPLLQPPA